MSRLLAIAAKRREDVRAAKLDVAESALWDRAAALGAELGPPMRLCNVIRASAPMALAAEFKRASPSKGEMGTDVCLEKQVLQYASAGARVISVLTEPTWFQGSLDDLLTARRALQDAHGARRPCVLRKDFVIDEYQIAEARAFGADTILIIVAIMDSDEQLRTLLAASRRAGMEPLVEVATEVAEARTDIRSPAGVAILALSGVRDGHDVARFWRAGAKGILVGETLMRAADPAAKARELLALLGDAAASTAVRADVPPPPLVKICGVRDAETAVAAARSGADLIGLICVPASKRFVPVDDAAAIVAAVRRFRESAGSHPWGDWRKACGTGTSSDPAAWFAAGAEVLRTAARRHRPLVVAVVQDADASDVQALVDATGVDLVQLHGSEQFGCSVSVPTLRVLHVPPFSESGARAEQVSSLVNEASKSVGTNLALLLDTAVRGQRGALGLVCLRSRPLMERQVELGVRSTGLSPRPSRWRASPS